LRGERYWRSLEELADNETFHELLHREFPRQASGWTDPLGRREFLKLMGASLALAGLTACGRSAATNEKIVPYVKQPESLVPGKPQFFATAFVHDGAATGLLVESHEGRPTKIEGNPSHPGSLGATDAFAQASILTLYDPDRSQAVTNVGSVATWNGFFAALNGELEGQRLNGGAGLRILTETVSSPTLADQLQSLLKRFPQAKWHQYEPANRDNVRLGARLAFGEVVEPQYHFERCETILSLDADFLFQGPGRIRYARDFIERRGVRDGNTAMNRLYAVESTPSLTGAMADHRLALRPTELAAFAQALAGRLGVTTGAKSGAVPAASSAKWLDVVTRDLQQHRGAALMIAGERQPAPIHALVHAINQSLGNTGKTVIYTEPVEPYAVEQNASLRDLAADMESGQVAVLLIIGGNPVFNAPADLQFSELMARVGFSVHLGLSEDETSARCHWHVPEAHYLETWSDARAYDGTVTILQPLIDPLYAGKSAHELLAAVAGRTGLSGYEIVREYWTKQNRAPDFERFWRRALHDGVVADSAFAAKTVGLKSISAEAPSKGAETKSPADAAGALEIIFQPDPTIHDGRFANNGWLQELPKPLTKITWDNAVLVSPATAQRFGLGHRVAGRGGEHGNVSADMVELRYAGRTMTAPVWVAPGHADGCATVYFGYGRTRAGKVGTGTGFNAYAIRTSAAAWQGTGLELRKTGAAYALACTQFHHNMEGRELVRAATLEEYRREPHFAAGKEHGPESEASLYPPHPYEGYAWGMTIDTNACIGCNACVVACQAENNIPVVGKTEVTHGREMHWIRIDRYYKGGVDSPETVHQPVPCMQCENAPCELVCPVNATNHSSEGLNDMVYNRCVGTRYCSNNCPYKVRRFNFFQFSDFTTPSLKPLRNPNVTVRSRGVMEKCTYCVQRINAAKITAEKEDRPVRDGEITTACQGACPTQAIVFGNINYRDSRVARLKAGPLNYGLLTELNTRPRTTYLAKLKNPNPELGSE
ncbi:MAG TPA: TAT-variant-translocated molybdopterin oxidoreductase, partial [Candidatus Saccharimonadales bacterium]|nr:TAT-variant-translocated molybdopterin oxidoreductase [Candidatus Saccharimonadales bacterium]